MHIRSGLYWGMSLVLWSKRTSPSSKTAKPLKNSIKTENRQTDKFSHPSYQTLINPMLVGHTKVLRVLEISGGASLPALRSKRNRNPKRINKHHIEYQIRKSISILTKTETKCWNLENPQTTMNTKIEKTIHREPKPQNRKSQGPRPRATEKLLDGDVTDKKN